MRFLRGFIFCLMCFCAATICGAIASSLLGAADGQGLAAGAIIVGYGLMTGMVGILIALFALKHLSVPAVKKLNILLAIVLLILAAFIAYRVNEKSKEKQLQASNNMGASKLGCHTRPWT